MVNLGIWQKLDVLGEKLSDSRIFSKLVGTVSRNTMWIFLEETENGYAKDFEGVRIEMKEAFHFTDIILHRPLEGYFREFDFEEMDRIIDAGAFPGAFAVVAAEKGAEVIALEPDPQNAEELRENIKMNGLSDRVKVVEKGLWKKKDEKSFERDEAIGMASRVKKGAEITIELDTLDSIISEHGEPDLVKMDIEGAEIEALEGAEETLEDIQPDFEIATYHLGEENRKTFHEVEKKLEKYRYSTKTEFSRHLTTYASKKIDFQ